LQQITALGVSFNAINIADLNTHIQNAIDSSKKIVVANHNLNSINLYHRTTDLKKLYSEADLVHIDGMLLVMWSKALGYDVSRSQRVTYVDWLEPLMVECVRQNWKIFFLGSKPGVAERAAHILTERHPGLQLQTHTGYFDVHGAENAAVVEQINAFAPHILMVGMGMPRQERWILENKHALNANVFLPSGACMDYVAGEVATPPRWMGRVGLEWLYRLGQEPKRLASRYLIEPWTLLPWIARDVADKVTKRKHQQ
jgi:N-acetylglucosaminyldiphosphoundecaprenol N-acetyl-beta-D-mannosaminyltransferase